MDALKRSLGINPQAVGSSPAPPPAPHLYFSSGPSPAHFASPRLTTDRLSPLAPPPSQPDTPTSDTPQVKQKLMSMWNNMKYGRAAWNLNMAMSDSGGGSGKGASFSRHSPVWLLGVRYHRKRGGARGSVASYHAPPPPQHARQMQTQQQQQEEEDPVIQAFKQDFGTRFWMTYRRDFQEFSGTSINTDCGWGCMIRSCQMIVANCLLIHQFGRGWRWKPSNSVMSGEEWQREFRHRDLVRLFGDTPNASVAPLSIHRVMSIADELLQRRPGDWFGPAAASHLLREAVDRSSHPLLADFCVYVANDCTVYRQDVRDMCRERAEARARRREASADASIGSAEDFSIVDHPTEYPGLLPGEAAGENSRNLFGGVVDGVPYFEEAREIEEVRRRKMRETPPGEREKAREIQIRNQSDDAMAGSVSDFQLLSDGTEYYSLNQPVTINGEQWIVEGEAAAAVTSTPAASPTRPGQAVRNGGAQKNLKKAREIQTEKPANGADWTPVLILIPVRLGGDQLNPLYIPSIKAMLASENCVGVTGGRPRHSLYFVGFQDDNLIHMDPHLVQDHVNVLRDGFPLGSFHCRTPRKMNVGKMDPSCCFGFLCQTKQGFEGWCELMKELAVPPGSDYPMFGVLEGRAAEHRDMSLSMSVSMSESLLSADDDGGRRAEDVSEDFVFL